MADLTEEQMVTIADLSRQGLSIREISRQSGASRRAVNAYFKGAGLAIDNPRDKSPERLEVERLLLDGIGPHIVAKMGIISRAAVYKAHKALSLKPTASRRRGGPAERATATRLLQEGTSNRKVCRLTGLAWGTVHRMREHLGIEPLHNIGIKGVPQIIAALRSRGHIVEVMPHLHTFDMLVDGARCELKCSNLGIRRSGVSDRYTFALTGRAVGALPSYYVTVVNGIAFKDYSQTSDYLVLAGFLDDVLVHLYRVSSKTLTYDKRNLQIIPAGAEHAALLWYEVR